MGCKITHLSCKEKFKLAIWDAGADTASNQLNMDSVPSYGSGVVRRSKQDKTRRSWNAHEEEVLLQALKDIITKGWKSENGFKCGYLNLLENAMQEAIPGSSLRGMPHINSKIHVWKKTYSNLVTLLSKSGVGWNDSNQTIDVNEETWEAILKTDPTLRSMKHKQWTLYHAWCDIFGNDRATGDRSSNFENAVNEVFNLDNEILVDVCYGDTPSSNPMQITGDSVSETHTLLSRTKEVATAKSKKRKVATEVDDSVVAAIRKFADITQETMGDLIKQLASEDKLSDAQDQVLNALQGMTDLSETDQVIAAKLLFNNHNDLALFQRLGTSGRLVLVRRLLSEQ